MPSAWNVCPTVAKMPGRLAVVTVSFTERLIFAFGSQATSTRRSGSASKAFSQLLRCTVIPRPRVRKPTISSPGSGLQHFV